MLHLLSLCVRNNMHLIVPEIVGASVRPRLQQLQSYLAFCNDSFVFQTDECSQSGEEYAGFHTNGLAWVVPSPIYAREKKRSTI
jgi:hypothetical protein